VSYIRISTMTPKLDQASKVDQILDELVTLYSEQPGFISGYRLRPHDGSARVGRIGIWETEADAERAANLPHGFALRSDLNRAVEAGSHQEYSFTGIEAHKS